MTNPLGWGLVLLLLGRAFGLTDCALDDEVDSIVIAMLYVGIEVARIWSERDAAIRTAEISAEAQVRSAMARALTAVAEDDDSSDDDSGSGNKDG